MKKIAVVLLSVAVLFSFSSCKDKCTFDEIKETDIVDISSDYTHEVYELEITATNVFNHSVGRSWQTDYTCEGREVHSGERWTVPSGTAKTLTIGAVLTEEDTYPDVGSSFLSVVMRDGFETTTAVTVTENKGRYRGNQAEWNVSCKVKLIEKIKK